MAILSKRPIEEVDAFDHVELGHARHVSARLENGVVIHNYYVPAGGDKPDREVNVKFGQKLDYLTEMRDAFHADAAAPVDPGGRPEHRPARGRCLDRTSRCWSVVSHTPVEVEHLGAAQEAGGWVDVTRADIPEGRLYSWWSYRSPDWDAADKGRRLDHVWASPDIAGAAHSSRIRRDARGWEQPSDHAPVFATFDL